jgi:PAS domain S-box-containing protein
MEVAGGLQIISIVRDISEQKSAEKKIAELAAIVEASDDAIISKSTGGIILNWNHGAEKLYGYKAEEVLGKHVSILALPGQSQEFDSITARVVEGEHIEQYETLRRRKNGSTVPVSLTVSPIRDHAGEVAAISIIGRDISFRKQTENALKEKTDELERSNTELEQFAYIASHDLREPLRTITSYLQLLQQRYAAQLDADGNEFIDFTVDGAKRMDRLIKDLLTYSRLGSANLQFEEVALSDTMEIVLSHLQESAKLQEAKITYDSLPVIVASGLQMVQLFQNLIMNAIKFRGPSPPEIHIGFMERPNDYLFSVTDNGIGIDPKYNKKIFAIFQRLHSREEYDGTGIGLAICKKIVERHKGEIWFEPNPAGGAKFYFTIEKLII